MVLVSEFIVPQKQNRVRKQEHTLKSIEKFWSIKECNFVLGSPYFLPELKSNSWTLPWSSVTIWRQSVEKRQSKT